MGNRSDIMRNAGMPMRSYAVALFLGLGACGTQQSDQKAPDLPSQMIASCALCHGADGSGNEARSAPRLAGQDAAYLERQLTAFAVGSRGTAPGDAFGPQMAVIAKSLDPAARKEAASYYASLPKGSGAHGGKSATVPRPEAFETCATCHGASGEGNAALGAPRLAGQPAWYLERSLQLYRGGGRGADKDDSSGQQMAVAAKPLSDADIANVAAYAASLNGEAK